MCRIKLAALDLGLEAETLNRMFVRSAEEVKGSVRGMRAGLRAVSYTHLDVYKRQRYN